MELESVDMLGGMYPYLGTLSQGVSPVLGEMHEYGRRRRIPIVGPLVGGLLKTIAMASGARRVLELGSGFGYSAAWFLEAGDAVRVWCTDGSTLNRDRALEFLGRAGVAERVEFLVGDCISSTRDLVGPFDIVFCDMDKTRYVEALEVARRLLRRGGVLIADNVLWRGYAWHHLPADAPQFRVAMTPGIRQFNRALAEAPDFVSTVLPLRDGVSVSVRR